MIYRQLLLILLALTFHNQIGHADVPKAQVGVDELNLKELKNEAKSTVSEEDEGSNYFSQAKAKEFRPEFAFGLNSSSYRVSGGGEYTSLVSALKVDLSYGVTDVFAVGTELAYSYGTQHFDQTSTTQGPEDLTLSLMFTNHRQGSDYWLRYGLDSTSSFGDAVEQADRSTNRFSGGHWLAPYVGAEYHTDSGTFGIKISHELPVTRRETKYEGKIDNEDAPEINGRIGLHTSLPGGTTTRITPFFERSLSSQIMLHTHLELNQSDKTEIYEGEPLAAVSPSYILVAALNIEQGKITHTPQLTYVMTSDPHIDGHETLGVKAEGLEIEYHIGF